MSTKLSGVRVLVLDDDEDARELAKTILSLAGAKVRVVASVAELLTCFDDYCPHVVVSDISMPEVSGLDMVKAMRERRAEDGGHTAVVALTALARNEQKQQGLKDGFDRYLTKPVNAQTLVDTVASVAEAA